MAQDDKALLQRLLHHKVEFVIIGGVCGIMHGVTLVTTDLDVCCRFTSANLYRIEAAVKDLHPYHRLVANRLPFELTDELVRRLKNLYLQTDLGKLDCLGEVAGVGSYDVVVQNSVRFNLSYGAFKVLNLDAAIASKEAVGRPRDLEAAKQLRAIRERARTAEGAHRAEPPAQSLKSNRPEPELGYETPTHRGMVEPGGGRTHRR